MKEPTNKNGEDRRTFIKSISATVVAGGLGMQNASAQDTAVDTTSSDLHICRGLNTTTSASGETPGTCEATNIPAADLHGCAGGNTCAGLGGCGTGDYATQYWTADNACGRSGEKWTGSGGCGVPIGSTNTGFICSQLNNAVPTPDENPNNLPPVLVGVPVWAIARARFEKKMVEAGIAFGVPEKNQCGEYKGNSWKPGDTYDRGTLPEPFPEPKPAKPQPS